jgi:hypothetical protein
MNKSTLSTLQVSGEHPRQYAAWLLYCESGSLEKTILLWQQVISMNDTEMMPIFGIPMGKPVGIATLKRWSSRYHWRQRLALKNKEDLADMRAEFKNIKQIRAYKVALLFDKIANKLLKQLDEGMNVTVSDLYIAWKMFRIEDGLPTSYSQIVSLDDPSQESKTSELPELDQEIQAAIDAYNACKDNENKDD